jgi:imidazolonepropionase-like amidohydrolase
LFAALAVVVILGFSASAQIALKGETVYTMNGAPIPNGVVLINKGKIEKVGQGIAVPDGYRVISGKVVTPGLVDAHSVVGLAGIYNTPADQMQLDRTDPMQPELRAIDAYNAREPLVEYLRTFGVTTLHTGHAPGALASGTTIVVKTVGNTVNEALIDSTGMVAFTLGESVFSNYKSPQIISKAVAMIRGDFLKARDYLKKKGAKELDKRPAPDLKMEMLGRVLRGEVKAMFTVHSAVTIMTVLRLQKEFGFKLVLDGAAEAPIVIDEIKKAGVPVIVHPTMQRPSGDSKSASFETAALLRKNGIPFAIQSGYESYVPKTRVVLFEAAIAAANGLSREDALASITIDAAKIIGVDRRVGSLEAGKDGDAVVFDGDPLEYTTHVLAVAINGSIASELKR